MQPPTHTPKRIDRSHLSPTPRPPAETIKLREARRRGRLLAHAHIAAAVKRELSTHASLGDVSTLDPQLLDAYRAELAAWLHRATGEVFGESGETDGGLEDIDHLPYNGRYP